MNIFRHVGSAWSILIVILFASPAYAEQTQWLRFEEVPGLEQLPNSEVTNLFQDSDGLIWIATTSGLYLYDGIGVQTYKSNVVTPDVFRNNRITVVGEDNDKSIYVGTYNGLSIIDKRSGQIRNSKAPGLNQNIITSIAYVAEDDIWLGTERGVMRYNPKAHSCVKFNPPPRRLNVVKSILLDSQNNLWFGTWNSGLMRYNLETEQFYVYPPLNAQNSAHTIYEDSRNRIWVGSFGYGLTLLNNPYDVESVTYTTFTTKSTPRAIVDNYIFDLAENEQTNSLWVGTRNGVTIIPMDFEQDWIYLASTVGQYSLPCSEIDAIISDAEGNVWVGGIGGGVRCVKTKSHHINSVELSGNRYNSIRSIYVDDKQNVWSGVSSVGVIVHYEDGRDRLYEFNSSSSSSAFVRVNHIAQSPKSGRMIFCTSSGLYVHNRNSGKSPFAATPLLEGVALNQILFDEQLDGYWVVGMRGLYYIDARTAEVSHKLVSKDSYTTICQGDDGVIWVGTEYNGLFKLGVDPNSGDVEVLGEYNSGNGLIASSEVMTLFRASDGVVWAGTNGGGLCRYDDEQNRFESLSAVSDFPTDLILSITEDGAGDLWLGSNIGLFKLTSQDELAQSSYRRYNKANGLPDNMFLPNAVAKDGGGNLYFGTHRGYLQINPMQLGSSNEKGQLYITDIKVNNRSISALDSLARTEVTPYTPNYSESINVSHTYSSFTVEFTALSYYNPNNIRYAYRLKGYDNSWQYTTSKRRFAHYANLPFGRYDLEIKHANEDGVWSDDIRTIQVNVQPPFYLTWWAKLIYFILFVALVLYITAMVRQRVNMQTTIKLQNVTHEKTEMLNHAKLRFFTNITHELFTPITIVAAAMEDNKHLLSSSNYEVVMSNINRLTRLIQQILEFRKAETGNLKLYVSKQNITEFVEKNIASFAPLMKKKSIQIVSPVTAPPKDGYIDTDKIDKILYNLLSNALKYNKQGAVVTVSLEYPTNRESVIIGVGDNGEGMSKRAMDNLFKRFYDGDFRRYNTSGTGIGLSLVNDLVRLHKGTIEVDNRPGEGVRFIVEIPIGVESYSAEECFQSEVSDHFETDNEELAQTLVENTTDEQADESRTILIVEDNADLLLLLSNILSRKYKTRTASNGVEALAVLKEDSIDIVVSDVMMPEMDGYELCKAIKTSSEHNHIPVLLLTAKREEGDAIDGYDSGADSIITKPVSSSVLLSRINNLLNKRAVLIEQFKSQSIFEPEALNYASYDEEFLTTTIKHITDNFSDAAFDQNHLSELLGMSKSTLHRKLKSLTGMTASSLIKETRMKCAYDMLYKRGNSRISDVAYAVGFNDPKYFSICFKKVYGYAPSDPPDEISLTKPQE